MKLKNCLTEKILKTVQHASNLKPYLESEQQDETRNVTEYESEKAAVTEHKKPQLMNRLSQWQKGFT